MFVRDMSRNMCTLHESVVSSSCIRVCKRSTRKFSYYAVDGIHFRIRNTSLTTRCQGKTDERIDGKSCPLKLTSRSAPLVIELTDEMKGKIRIKPKVDTDTYVQSIESMDHEETKDGSQMELISDREALLNILNILLGT